MAIERNYNRTFWRCSWSMVLLGCVLASVVHAQPVLLSVQRSNNQVTVLWPPGLSLVQPQKATNLSAPSWQSLGSPTSASNQTDVVGPGAAFYRLRFLAPTVTTPPQSQTVAVGANVALNVAATGTAPLSYQWRKDNSALAGQTNPNLNLNNAATGNAGSYSVVITNRAGSITSVVASLSVTNPLTPPRGIYTGNFSGSADNGGFAAMVRSNGTAVVVGYNIPQDEGVFISNFSVAVNGTFNATTTEGGMVSGTFTTNSASGTFRNSTGGTGTFSGNRKQDTGTHGANAGYYTGTYTGQSQGNVYAILAADGAIYCYTFDSPSSPTFDGSGGGIVGTINSGNSLSGSTVPSEGVTVTGTLNATTKVITGFYRLGGQTLGTFTLTRNSIP